MNSSPEQPQWEFYLCLLFFLQQIKPKQSDFSNFRFNRIEMMFSSIVVALCVSLMRYTCLVLHCESQSVWLNNELQATREPTSLITQINKHVDEHPQWNNGNTTSTVTSVEDSGYLQLTSHNLLCLLNILFFIFSWSSFLCLCHCCSPLWSCRSSTPTVCLLPCITEKQSQCALIYTHCLGRVKI